MYKINAILGAIESTKTDMIAGTGNARNHEPVLHHGDICMDRNDENKIVYGSYAGGKVFISNNKGDSFIVSSASIHPDVRTVDVVNRSDGENSSV